MSVRQRTFKGRATTGQRDSIHLKMVMNRQKMDRQELLDSLRDLLVREEEEEGRPSGSITDYMMYPDWMVEKPVDLNLNWLVQMRPEGKRVVFMVKSGKTRIYDKHGHQISPSSVEINYRLLPLGLTILDCVLSEQGVLYVMDVLYWDKGDIASNDAESRHFWLKSRFAEIDLNLEQGMTDLSPSLVYVEAKEASIQNIESLYFGNPNFTTTTDSLLFTQKQSPYLPGLSRTYLQWRDIKLSRYVIDTSDITGETIPQKQKIVVIAKQSGTSSKVKFFTWDEIYIGQIHRDEFPSEITEKYSLVRLKAETLDEETKLLVNISDIQKVSYKHRIFPDSFNRIKTQAWFRKTQGEIPPVTIQEILLVSSRF
jgi:hypothetical protein